MAGLQGVGTGEGGNHDAASFGLPPGVHNGAAAIAHHVVVPLPGLEIDGFTHRAQHP